jgi:hypothetical protein
MKIITSKHTANVCWWLCLGFVIVHLVLGNRESANIWILGMLIFMYLKIKGKEDERLDNRLVDNRYNCTGSNHGKE